MFIRLILLKINVKSYFYCHSTAQRLMPSLPTSIPRSYPFSLDVSPSTTNASTQIESIIVLQLRTADVTPVMVVMAVLFFLGSRYACVQVFCVTNMVIQKLERIKFAFSCLKTRKPPREAGAEEANCPNGPESETSGQDSREGPHS